MPFKEEFFVQLVEDYSSDYSFLESANNFEIVTKKMGWIPLQCIAWKRTCWIVLKRIFHQ